MTTLSSKRPIRRSARRLGFLLTLSAAASLPSSAYGRSWTDIMAVSLSGDMIRLQQGGDDVLVDSIREDGTALWEAPADPYRLSDSVELLEDDPFPSFSPSSLPSSSPTFGPTSSPSSSPSGSPSSSPTLQPSDSPSSNPTLRPSDSPTVSVRPSFKPTLSPTFNPTHTPTAHPTPSPTSNPTAKPTPSPTSAKPTPSPTSNPTAKPTPIPTPQPTPGFQTNPLPPSDSRSRGYFNYNPDSKYGPRRGWEDVRNSPERKYWREFEEYIREDLDDNECDSGSDKQSPIDVRKEDATGVCLQYHEFRHRQGIYPMLDKRIEKQILPTKLRLEYPRRSANQPEGTPGPPSADVPKGWGHQLDVTHIDIKLPSEHYMEGKQYPGEYQIYIIQKKGRGAPAASVFMDFHPRDEDNEALQYALDEFQKVSDATRSMCGVGPGTGGGNRKQRERRLGEEIGKAVADAGFSFNGADASGRKNRTTREHQGGSSLTNEQQTELDRRQQRGLAKRGTLRPDLPWDPWHPDLMPGYWFFGYEGSLTEPPCSEFLEWHVFTEPMLISRKQHRQMQDILFNQVDPDDDCRRSSSHYEGSVARPLQPLKGRNLYKCNCRDFISDDDRKWYGRNRCWDGEEYLFHPKEFPNPLSVKARTSGGGGGGGAGAGAGSPTP